MEKRKHLKTLSNSTVTLIPKLLSFLASSTSKISPGLGGDEGKVLKFILLDVFMEEEDSLTKKNKQKHFFPQGSFPRGLEWPNCRSLGGCGPPLNQPHQWAASPPRSNCQPLSAHQGRKFLFAVPFPPACLLPSPDALTWALSDPR